MSPKRTALITLLLALFLGGTSYLALARDHGPNAQPAPAPSNCLAESEKNADPTLLTLGQDTGVTLVVSATCGADEVPIDLVIVADESLSMTEGRGTGPGNPTERPTPEGSETPTRTGPGPGLPTDESGEPSFCPGGSLGRPSPTPTRRFQFRTPTPGPPEPTEVPEFAGQEDLIRASQQWVRDFVREPAIERDLASGVLKIGFVSFNSRVQVKQPLSSDPSDAISAASRLRGADITRINVGMAEAERVLKGTGSRPEDGRTTAIIVLSDFEVCQRDVTTSRPDPETKVVTVGMGRDFDAKKARDMASDRSYALEQRDMKELMDIYQRELTSITGLTMAEMVINDELAPNMQLVADSAQPPPSSTNGQLLQWTLPLPVFPLSLTYRVMPQDVGVHPVSVQAAADWTDSSGSVGQVTFPDVQVEVVAPTPSATPTSVATPTPTAKPPPAPRYLPIAYLKWPEAPTATPCVPALQSLDVALVIDNSTSMSDPTEAGGQPKLAAAIEAASAFVTLIKDTDQAAVVSFNATARVAQGITTDKAALLAALQGLPATQASGTSIDLGLLTGRDELHKSARVPDTRSIVLVTDGQQTGAAGRQGVIDAANAAKAEGIQIVAVGLGSADEIDEALLREIASSPAHYFPAPSAADLVRIYREIVDVIPCR